MTKDTPAGNLCDQVLVYLLGNVLVTNSAPFALMLDFQTAASAVGAVIMRDTMLQPDVAFRVSRAGAICAMQKCQLMCQMWCGVHGKRAIRCVSSRET